MAQVPAEVQGVSWSGPDALTWLPAGGADDYNVYRTLVSQLAQGGVPRCHADEVVDLGLVTAGLPPAGDAFAYLISGESDAGGEGHSARRALATRARPSAPVTRSCGTRSSIVLGSEATLGPAGASTRSA
ncbi:MAG: hypothetical protein HC882_02160 [Acidobacteria bacterium]|nr:hypothetical protein [Acidobacteriota bacterium]